MLLYKYAIISPLPFIKSDFAICKFFVVDLLWQITCTCFSQSTKSFTSNLLTITCSFNSGRGHVSSVKPIFSARVPILKVVDAGTGVECDISVENRDGILKSQIVHMISSIDDRFQKLCFLVRHHYGLLNFLIWLYLIVTIKNLVSVILKSHVWILTSAKRFVPPFSSKYLLLLSGHHQNAYSFKENVDLYIGLWRMRFRWWAAHLAQCTTFPKQI